MKALLLAVALVSGAEAPQVRLDAVPAVPAAAVAPQVVPEVCRVEEAVPCGIGVFPEARTDVVCSLVDFYVKRRLLSGPWSAFRRLEAARLRGDAAEELRMAEMLDRLFLEALDAEEEGGAR